MKENGEDTGKGRIRFEEDGSLAETKRDGADADAVPESDELMDDLESRLDELFAADYDESADAKKDRIATASSATAGRSPIRQKAAESDSGAKIQKASVAPAPAKKPSDSSEARPAALAPRSDSMSGPAPKKSVTPPADVTKPDPAVDAVRAEAEAEVRAPEKMQPAFRTRKPRQGQPAAAAAGEAQSAVSGQKSPEKADRKPIDRRQRAKMAALGAVVLVGVVTAVVFFLQSPGPSEKERMPAAPVAHKIIKPSAGSPGSNTTRVSASAAAKGSGRGRIRPNPSPAVSIDEKASAAAAGLKNEIAAAGQEAAASISPESATAISDRKAPVSAAGPKNDATAAKPQTVASSQPKIPPSASADARVPAAAAGPKNDATAAKPQTVASSQPKIPPSASADAKASAAAAGPKIEIAAARQDASASGQPKPVSAVSAKEKEPAAAAGPKNRPAEARRKTAEAAAPKPASYPYSIHASSYRTLAPAREDVEIFRKMGLQAYWVPVDLGKIGFWYRVFVGHYPDAESAEKVLWSKKLKDAIAKETRYANLIGTYPSEESLQGERKLLLKKGFSPYIVMEPRGSRRLYVGAYDTLKSAEKMSAELKAGGIPSQVVER